MLIAGTGTATVLQTNVTTNGDDICLANLYVTIPTSDLKRIAVDLTCCTTSRRMPIWSSSQKTEVQITWQESPVDPPLVLH